MAVRAFTIALAFALLGGGCIPLHETWRPAITGRVVTSDGAAVPSEKVVACTKSHWRAMSTGCDFEAVATTDRNGVFQFPPERMWHLMIIFLHEEAPLPRTFVAACGPPVRSMFVDGDATAVALSKRSVEGEESEWVERYCAAPNRSPAR